MEQKDILHQDALFAREHFDHLLEWFGGLSRTAGGGLRVMCEFEAERQFEEVQERSGDFPVPGLIREQVLAVLGTIQALWHLATVFEQPTRFPGGEPNQNVIDFAEQQYEDEVVRRAAQELWRIYVREVNARRVHDIVEAERMAYEEDALYTVLDELRQMMA